jgi:hypothetical protein
MNPVPVKDMGKKYRPRIALEPALKKQSDNFLGGKNHPETRFPPMVFSTIPELAIIFFCISYSLFCLDAYLLNAIHLKLTPANLLFLLIVELWVLGYCARKKITLFAEIKTALYAVLVFLISFLISLNISPSLLPNNWSYDYPNHYILIDFLSVHEQLPPLTSGLGEMAQYPFGPSLFTSVFAKIIALPLMTTIGFIAAVIAALIAVMVYLLARELLRRYPFKTNLADAAALISPFMVFSIPIYFLDQYCGNFYYSMMFGELLVLVSLLALMKVEAGDRSWIFIFILTTMGIVFTYTLFIIIPVLALVLFAILNPEKVRALLDPVTILSGLLVAFLFGLFSYERLIIGSHILQSEGLTIDLDIMNFNIIFIVFVISGIILCCKMMPGALRGALFTYDFVIISEYFAFLFLNHFGIIAVYYANKIFYLLILVVSVSACLPIIYMVRKIQKDHLRTAAAVSIISLIGLFSVFIALTYPAVTKPVVTNEDVIFAQKTEAYLQKNAIPYQNLSITTGELKGYWLGLLLHMDRNYAQQQFLEKPTAFNDWLKNPDARYVAGEMVNASYPEFFEMGGVRLQIVVREGRKVLIRKVD